ncbi:MAG: right-handed parallel beta-helix repeat-containing protein [Candidatus Eisenbacteria bacterium]
MHVPAICLLLIVLLLGCASPVFAITHITSNSLAASATWGPSGTIVDTEFWIEPPTGVVFTIPAATSLTIQPGTLVRIKGGVSIVVNGTLNASGTQLSPTTFDVTPSFTQWGGFELATTAAFTLSGCNVQAFGTYPVHGTIPQVASVFSTNVFVPRADGHFNAIWLRGSTLTASITLTAPGPDFCYVTSNSDAFEIAGAGAPVLTIADRTVIKFGASTYLRTGTSGVAGGLRAKGVVFTSTLDDTLGDTTNNGLGSGAPNQWQNLRFESGTLDASTVLDSCIVRFGGNPDDYGVLVADAQPTITRCVIRDNQGYGLRLQGNSTGALITSNLLRDNTSFEISATLQGIGNLATQNTITPSVDGKLNAYHVQSSTLTTNLTLPKPAPGFCYYTSGGTSFEIAGAGGPVLTIADGTVLKLGSSTYLRTGTGGVAGGLRAKGVVFTSTQDDTLGDTNNDGTATAGAPNQWQNLRFESGTLDASTVLDSCIVRFGGNPDGYGVLVADAQPTITRCVIRDNQGYGLELTGTSTGSAITANLLRDNTTFEVDATLGAAVGLVTHNSIANSRNGRFDAIRVQGSTTSGAITMPRLPVPMVYYLAGSVTVPAGATLAIQGGCVLKMASGVRLLVQGTLNIQGKVDNDPLRPVIFTSIRDDDWWGDTNGDGPSTGVAGDWLRLELAGANNASVVDGAIFTYGGAGGLGQLYINATGTQAVPNVLVKNSHFYLSGAVTGVRSLASNARLDSCSFFGTSAQAGVSNGTNTITVIASNSWWGASSGPADPSVVDPCSNPAGGGVGVTDFVNYCPFLTTGAPVTDAPPPFGNPLAAGFVWIGPVPATNGVRVRYAMGSERAGSLEFLDLAGRVLHSVELAGSSEVPAEVEWDLHDRSGSRVHPGVVFVRLRVGRLSQVRKVILAR